MHLKYKQTDNCNQRPILSQTIPVNYNQNMNKLKGSHSKSQRTIEKSPAKMLKHQNILPKAPNIKKSSSTTTLKGKYDELVAKLFIMIDFDCTGYISFTKISYCKEIPQNVFYFFGGVFQQIKYLGAVTMKMFSSLCQEVYLHTKKEDIESIVNGQPKKQVLKKKIEFRNQLDNGLTVKLRFRSNEKMKSEASSDRKKDSRFSTKKIVYPLCTSSSSSPKVKTESTEEMQRKKQCYFKSERKIMKENNVQIENVLPIPSNINESHYLQQVQNLSFQSDKIRVLTERLDTQILRNKQRLFNKRIVY